MIKELLWAKAQEKRIIEEEKKEKKTYKNKPKKVKKRAIGNQFRNGMDLTEAECIKKRWQEYTEELYKKDIHDTDNHTMV